MEAELAHLSVQDISADEVLREAGELYARWPALPVDEKRKIVESIAEKIVIGIGEIEIRLAYLPSSSEVTSHSQQHLVDP